MLVPSIRDNNVVRVLPLISHWHARLRIADTEAHRPVLLALRTRPRQDDESGRHARPPRNAHDGEGTTSGNDVALGTGFAAARLTSARYGKDARSTMGRGHDSGEQDTMSMNEAAQAAEETAYGSSSVLVAKTNDISWIVFHPGPTASASSECVEILRKGPK